MLFRSIENEVALASSMWHTVLGVTITPKPFKDLKQALAATRGNSSLQLWVSDYTQATLDTYATIGLPFAQNSPLNVVNYGQNSSTDAAQQQALQLKLASRIPGIQTDEEMDLRADQQLSEEVAWLPVYRI